ncbi:MAG: ABC transporter ATP-binding protein [Bacilli bacterium]|nr:ABC transporter ATP-binding protein [Bacilli bacterium]
MKRVFGYIQKYRLRLEFQMVIKIIGTLMDLVIPYILSYIIDEVVPTNDVQKIVLLGLLMIGCAVIGLVGNVKANQMASMIAKRVTTEYRHDVFSKIQELSPAQVDEVTIPSIISRMTTDTYNVHHMVGMMQRIGIRAPILFIGGIIVTLILDAKLTLVLIAILPIIVILTYIISKVGIPLYTNVQVALDELVRAVRENATGVRVIKALSKENYEKEKFRKINKDVIDLELKSGYTMSILNPIINFLLNAGLVMVIVIGAIRVNGGDLLPGKILAFTTYFTIILNATLSITRIFTMLSRSIASAKRIEYIMSFSKDLEVSEEPKLETTDYITFSNVSFSYHKQVDNLTDINFSIKKGETLGIIGATGSGKSTLIQLLMRFYDVDKGAIYINGRNIKSIPSDELKKMFGVVFQNDCIFSDTIFENINFGRGYDIESVKEAARISSIHDFIETLPEGYNTELNARGTNLSGGQKLRVLIARSIVGNPDILILDDASSALDYKTDAAIRSKIKETKTGTTQIIVAQRISSVLSSDHILMLEDGKIIASGKHEELLKTSPEYLEIYKLQMGGVQDAK